MRNNPLDDIVKCNVDISSPASNDATFDSILLIVPGPAGEGTKTMEKTTAVSKADELLDYGFTTEDAAYVKDLKKTSKFGCCGDCRFFTEPCAE